MSVFAYTIVSILILAAAMTSTRLDLGASDGRKHCSCEG